MAKSDIISTVSTRIAAATSATPADELAILKVLGTKLGLNTSNIVSQANTASNNASTRDLTDVTLLNQALDDYVNNRNATVTLPFAVEAGNTIYVDDFGSVFKNSTNDIVMAAHTTDFVASDSFNPTPINSFSGLGNSPSLNTVFAHTLSDGNLLIGFGGTVNSTPTGFTVQVLSPNLVTRFSTLTVPTINHDSGNILDGGRFLGCVQTSTNNFRITYISKIGDGSLDVNSRIYTRTFTYNPATRTLGSLSAVSSLYNTPADNWGLSTLVTNGAFVLLGFWENSTYRLISLNLFTGTVVTYTTFTGSPAGAIFVYTTSDGITRWLVRSTSNTIFIFAANTNTQVTAPANLTQTIVDYAHRLNLGNGLFLFSNQNARNIRLVQFNSNSTTCDIYTIGNDIADNNSALINLQSCIRTGNNYIIFNTSGSAVLSFNFTIGSAPVVVNPTIRSIRRYLNSGGTNILNTSLEMIQVQLHIVAGNRVVVFIRCTGSCLVRNAVSMLGVCTENVLANTSTVINLVPYAVPSQNSTIQGVPHGLGYKITGRPDFVPTFKKLHSSRGSNGSWGNLGPVTGSTTIVLGAGKSTINVGSHSATFFNNGGVFDLVGNSSNSGSITVITALFQFTASHEAGGSVTIFIETNEPFLTINNTSGVGFLNRGSI
jgi:hypothetical protein